MVSETGPFRMKLPVLEKARDSAQDVERTFNPIFLSLKKSPRLNIERVDFPWLELLTLIEEQVFAFVY